MTDTIPVRIEVLVDHISAYVYAHPYAADSVAGIQNWWLSEATSGVSRRDVEEAIGILLTRGTLEGRTLLDGTRIYARGRG